MQYSQNLKYSYQEKVFPDLLCRMYYIFSSDIYIYILSITSPFSCQYILPPTLLTKVYKTEHAASHKLQQSLYIQPSPLLSGIYFASFFDFADCYSGLSLNFDSPVGRIFTPVANTSRLHSAITSWAHQTYSAT